MTDRTQAGRRVDRLMLSACALLLTLGTLVGCGFSRGLIREIRWRQSEHYRYQRVVGKAEQASRAGDLDKALRLYDRAEAMVPETGPLRIGRALAHARAGDLDRFYSLAEAAAAAGFDDVTPIVEEPVLRVREDEPRLQSLLERLEANGRESWQAFRQASRMPVSEDVPVFDSLEALAAWFDEQGESDIEPWKVSRESGQKTWLEEERRRALRVASLERYLAEHPGAPDRVEALEPWLDAWVALAGTYNHHWRRDLASGIDRAAVDFLAADPAEDARRRALFLHAETLLRGVLPAEGPYLDWWDWPSLDCEAATPALEAFLAEEGDDHWRTRALGLLALCVSRRQEQNPRETAAVYERFAARPEISWEDLGDPDFRMRVETLEARLRTQGAPDFTAETLDGETVTLSALKGQVVLVEFWGPG